MSYYFYNAGFIYQLESTMLIPITNKIVSGYGSKDEAMSVLYEFIDILSKNTIRLPEEMVEIQSKLVNSMEILSSDDIRISETLYNIIR